MGNATILAAAFAVIVLIILIYFLGGIITTTGELISFAQKEQTNIIEDNQRSAIIINSTSINTTTKKIMVELINTGSVTLADYKSWDIFTESNGEAPIRYTYTSSPSSLSAGSWAIDIISPDTINPNLFDPTERMNITVKYSDSESVSIPSLILAGSANGAVAEAKL